MEFSRLFLPIFLTFWTFCYYFDISHELLLAKLHAFGFDKISLTFMHAHLNQRNQKTKVGSTFSELVSILLVVHQGSILGSLLFIIYICNLFIAVHIAVHMIPLLLFTEESSTKYLVNQKMAKISR